MSSRRPHLPGARPAADPVAGAPRPPSRPTARPGGAATSRDERRPRSSRSRPPSDQPPPRTLTVRSLVIGLVVLVAFVVLAPTLRAFVTQSEQQRRVDAQYAAVQADVERLERELARWNDPAYVQAQARERLSYVMPGEVAYRVIDPQSVPSEDPEAAGYVGLVEPEATGPSVPWYLTMWDSVVEAGAAEVPAREDEPGGAGEGAPDEGPGDPAAGP